MIRTLARDYHLLLNISKYQNKITTATERFQCTSNYEILKDEMLTDLIAMYCSQIGEIIKGLSWESKKQLTFVNTDASRHIRNKIAHTYDDIDKRAMVAYANRISNENAKEIVKSAIQYCAENKNK